MIRINQWLLIAMCVVWLVSGVLIGQATADTIMVWGQGTGMVQTYNLDTAEFNTIISDGDHNVGTVFVIPTERRFE